MPPRVWFAEGFPPDQQYYMIETGQRGELRYGILVNIEIEFVGREEPLDTIVRFTSSISYAEYQGNLDDLPLLVRQVIEKVERS